MALGSLPGLSEAHPVLREKPSKRPLSWGPGQTGRPVLLFGAHDIYRASVEVKLKNNKNTAVTNLFF